ncbi:hypothetical protein TEA_009057 [Camellia sinensis var. sinensis]|uniref:Uncharacterized protein n=1 Tax=Camellia sinensis var. sinensis TaxID=542762 RepID=A0A4S4DF40_CAMSN|nr:hypothetical protein TEA_009057 [Camellia sinensis var. sinensis]
MDRTGERTPVDGVRGGGVGLEDDVGFFPSPSRSSNLNSWNPPSDSHGLREPRSKREEEFQFSYGICDSGVKEELDWNEMLIKQYIGREALWLHRRFLSFCWTKHFVTDIHDISSHSDHKDTMNHEIGVFMDTELELVCSCSTIPDNDYEDFQAQAMFSATYLLWLTKQISEFMGIEFREK